MIRNCEVCSLFVSFVVLEFANEDSQTKKAENESLEELEEEEEEDDYEIILDTSKLPTSNSVGNLNNDLNK